VSLLPGETGFFEKSFAIVICNPCIGRITSSLPAGNPQGFVKNGASFSKLPLIEQFAVSAPIANEGRGVPEKQQSSAR
jgi:hypothetical protein